MSSLLIVTLKAHGAKKTPKPLKITRPQQAGHSSGQEAISFGEYMQGRLLR